MHRAPQLLVQVWGGGVQAGSVWQRGSISHSSQFQCNEKRHSSGCSWGNRAPLPCRPRLTTPKIQGSQLGGARVAGGSIPPLFHPPATAESF